MLMSVMTDSTAFIYDLKMARKYGVDIVSIL